MLCCEFRTLMLEVLLIEDNLADALLVEVALEEVATPTRMVHVSRLSEALALLSAPSTSPAESTADYSRLDPPSSYKGRRDGESALAADEPPGLESSGQFDVVLLDLNLPDSQGPSSFRRVHEVAPDVPLIALTGLDDQKTALEALQSGASDYLIKGQTDAALLERSMRYAIERKKSERARIELALAQAEREEAHADNRAKDEFIATLSHELRTPLNAILGWASMLRTNNVPPAQQAIAFETIERNARAQAQLIEDLLDVSRIITGKLSLERRVLDFNEVITNALASVLPQVGAKNLRLKRESNSPLFVYGDAVRLQQVVWNLLSNAVKFTSAGGSVHISARVLPDGVPKDAQVPAPQVLAGGTAQSAAKATVAGGNGAAAANGANGALAGEAQEGWLELEVRDTGQGIAPEFLPHVFDRFRQADGSTTRRHGGLGIGLAIVRSLVQAHGGSISARSAGVSQGAAFTVRLPIMHAAAPDSACELNGRALDRAAPMSASTLEGLQILGVDDEADARHLIQLALASCGATVKLASSGREAMEMLRAWCPDVIVSDVGMPEMDGYDFLHALRSQADSPASSTPAIALTGYARDEERQRAVAVGFEGFLTKPVDLNLLARAVAMVAGR
jgi:signal transduction histidine kinase